MHLQARLQGVAGLLEHGQRVLALRDDRAQKQAGQGQDDHVELHVSDHGVRHGTVHSEQRHRAEVEQEHGDGSAWKAVPEPDP